MVKKVRPLLPLVGLTLRFEKLMVFPPQQVKDESLHFITDLLKVKLPKSKLPQCRY